MTARAHGIPTPSLTPETKELASAADRILGPSLQTRSPLGSTTTTPISPHFYGGSDQQLVDVLRQSPGIDLSKLNIQASSVGYQ